MDFSALSNTVLATFGEGPTQHVTVDGEVISAIYDSRHFDDGSGETGTSDLITTISVRSSDLPEITDATVFVVRGVVYRRWEVRPDGQGMTVIQLERRA